MDFGGEEESFCPRVRWAEINNEDFSLHERDRKILSFFDRARTSASIQEAFGLSAGQVSAHLRSLQKKGVVFNKRRLFREVEYRIISQPKHLPFDA